MSNINDKWGDGDPYEYFMGRWSKLLAPEFLNWLNISPDKNWLEIGCGTGALTKAILLKCEPSHLTSIDPSEGFLAKTRERVNGKGKFLIGHAAKLPVEDDTTDIVVSGLALNFFPDLNRSLAEMRRVSKRDGLIAGYVWDYSDRMDMLRYFWDAAYQIDPNSRGLDEGVRFPICKVNNLQKAFQEIGLSNVEVAALDIKTHFKDFDDFWNPFLGGQGPAPGYLASLPADFQEKLRKTIYDKLPIESDGSIQLLGRAFAVKGTNL